MNPLVGREPMLSALGAHLDATARGSGGCVVVEGPFGMGKSRLLKATALAGAERGLAVIAGRAGGGHQPIPHLLINFLRHVMSGAADFDDLVRPDANPFWLTDRLTELVEHAARRRPLVIVLDDAQQVDDVSGLALRGLVQSLATSPVLWLLGRRPVPTRSLAQHAIGWLIDHAAVRLQLGALDSAAVAELCAGVLGATPDASALSWAARCGGNPQLVENLFGALTEAGQVVIVDGTASVVAERLPEGVLTAVGRQLDRLPPPVRRLLVHGRRIGDTFTVEEAAALLDEPALELSSSVDEAVQGGLMLRNGIRLALAHEVIGEALQHAALRGSTPATVPATVVATVPAIGRGTAGTPSRPRPGSGGDGDIVAARAVSALRDLSDEAPGALAPALRLLTGAGRDAEAGRLAEIAISSGIEPAALMRTAPRERPAHRAGSERPLWTWLVRALTAADRFEEAAAVCSTVEQEAGELGQAWPEPLWYGHRAGLLAAAGRLEEARADAEAALGLTARTPEDHLPARVVLARVSIHRGDLATASDQLRLAERLLTGDAAADRTGLDWALALFHAASERPEMTVQTLINVEGQVEPDPLLFTETPTAAATLVRLARQVGLGAEAERAAEFARRIAERNPAVSSLAGGAEHAEGLLRRDSDALHRAVELYQLAARPLAAGGALEDAAREEHRMRHKARTARLLESALDLYMNCGAQRDVARTQRKLRRLGVHNVRGTGADRPKSGWESLTGAELRVVRAIVDGQTNREAASTLFLSPHTVDSHLRHVFFKLDINSRVELTKQFLAHEGYPPAMAAAQHTG